MSSEARERDEVLTSREARELLKIGRTKLWELTHTNVIPAYRVGNGKRAAPEQAELDEDRLAALRATSPRAPTPRLLCSRL